MVSNTVGIAGRVAVSRWVFNNSNSSSSDCADNCANNCGNNVRNNSDFRSGVFGAVASWCAVILNTKQNFANLQDKVYETLFR